MNRSRAVAVLVAVLTFSFGGCGESPTLVVSGTVVGHDGAPMPLAHVHLLRPLDWDLGKQPLASAQASADGSFEIATAETGLLILTSTGVDHRYHRVPVIVEEQAEGPVALSIDVRLATLDYHVDVSGVRVIGDFNEFGVASGRPMEARADGTYTLDIEVDADTLAYQLVDIARVGRRASGTQSDAFAYGGWGGAYRSVVGVQDGSVTITFDPTKLAYSPEPPQVTFSDPSSSRARFASLELEMTERYEAFYRAFETARETDEELEYDWSGDVAHLAQRLESERDPFIREVLSYQLLHLGCNGAEIDSELVSQALVELPPTSYCWSLDPYFLACIVETAFPTQEDEAASAPKAEETWPVWVEKAVDYVEEGIIGHPDSVVRASMLASVVIVANNEGLPDLGAEYYGRLTEEYPESWATRMAREYAPQRNIQVGKPIPEFSLTSLDDTTIVYARDSLLGTVYLIDFWATWCIPCVAEMPSLHRVHREFGPRGFEILSISMDDDLEEVIAYRNGEWEMPWYNVFAGPEFEAEMLAPFELVQIPKAILVDAEGMIVGLDAEAHGEGLRQILAQLLTDLPAEGTD
ncbi:MAG: TlpA family protein disulfide reductase [Gemmatimonadota bacterium]|nr:MAG: TlpA family protein disulfide reductase [Gemmatimonadota bacterium]